MKEIRRGEIYFVDLNTVTALRIKVSEISMFYCSRR